MITVSRRSSLWEATPFVITITRMSSVLTKETQTNDDQAVDQGRQIGTK